MATRRDAPACDMEAVASQAADTSGLTREQAKAIQYEAWNMPDRDETVLWHAVSAATASLTVDDYGDHAR